MGEKKEETISKEKKNFATIGYGKTDLKTFIRILLKYKVNYIVDVRSSPYSKYCPQYNKDVFEIELTKHNISYKWMGNLLGGRPKDSSLYDENGVVDYVKFAETELFLTGINTLENLCLENNIAILCSEQDPMKCHRFLAISRKLSDLGYKVYHILGYDYCKKHSQLEDALVEIHFKRKRFEENVQIDLFSNVDDTFEADILAQSYIKQNKQCAYRRK